MNSDDKQTNKQNVWSRHNKANEIQSNKNDKKRKKNNKDTHTHTHLYYINETDMKRTKNNAHMTIKIKMTTNKFTYSLDHRHGFSLTQYQLFLYYMTPNTR